MGTHAQRLRERLGFPLPAEDGRGDTSRSSLAHRSHTSIRESFTLLHEFGGTASSFLPDEYSFKTKFIVTSSVFALVWLLSYLSTWASFVYDFAKPVYFVCLGGMGVLRLLEPTLHKLDELLMAGTNFQEISDEETEHGSSPHDDHTVITRPPLPGMPLDIAWKRGLISEEFTDDYVVNLPSARTSTDLTACFPSESSVPKWSSSSDTSSGRSTRTRTWIPAPAIKYRKVRARATATASSKPDAVLLRALENELRKEHAL